MALESYFADFARRDWQDGEPDGSVRLAIVGVGGFARRRALPAIDRSDFCEATVLVSGSPERTATVAERFGVPHVVGYDAYVAGEVADAYDAVYVATPNATHGEYAIAAAELGKHVVVEKPLEATVADARDVVAACDRAGVVLMTAYRLQLEPAVRRTRELLRDGVIGDPVQIHGGFSNPLLAHAGSDSWRLDPALAGGGALIDLGLYPLNTVRFLLERDPTAVQATTHSVAEPFAAVDEHVAFQLEFPGPITASCTASFNAHSISGLRVIGTEGMIRISSPFGGPVPQDVYVECGEVGLEYTGQPIDEVVEEFDYFAYCVLTGTAPEPDGADGLTDLRTVAATYEAADRGERVAIG